MKSSATFGNRFSLTQKQLAWLVWSLGAAFFFAEYFTRIAPGVMVPELTRAFATNALGIGAISGGFYFAYVGMQVPVGILVDKFGPRRLLTLNSLLCGIGCLLFAFSHVLEQAVFARVLMGFGSAFAFVSTLKLASVWFPSQQFGLLAGLTQALGMLGAAVGDAPMAMTVDSLGWRNTMLLIAAIFVLLAIATYWIVRDQPTRTTAIAAKEVSQTPSPLKGLLAVISSKQNCLNALYAGLLFAPTTVFGELWGVSYLVNVYGLSKSVAASAVGMVFVGWACGGPIVGWLSDRLGQRRPLMLVSAICGLVIMGTVLWCAVMPVWLLFLLLFLFGVTNTGLGLAYATAVELNPRALSGTAAAFANMTSVIIGAVLQPIIGGLLDRQVALAKVKGFSTALAYQHAFIVLPICFVLAFLLAFYVRETYCRPVVDEAYCS